MHVSKKAKDFLPQNSQDSILYPSLPLQVENQRSPLCNQKESIESMQGEMFYLDPNDPQFHSNMIPAMSPTNQRGPIQFTRSRSPPGRIGVSVINTARKDFDYVTDTLQQPNRRLHVVNLTMKKGKDTRRERSPKNINLGDTENDIKYNQSTLNIRRIKMNANMNSNNSLENSNVVNETGNIFLDQPLPNTGFFQGSLQSPNQFIQNRSNNEIIFNGSSREIQYSAQPRETFEVNASMRRGSDSTIQQLNDLKSQISLNSKQINEGANEVIIKGEVERVDDRSMIKNKNETIIKESELKKMVREMGNEYNPNISTEGRLINAAQTIIPGKTRDKEVDNERYKVLQKMNKLSTILLSRREGSEMKMINRNIDEKKKTFDRNTLNSSLVGKKKQIEKRSAQNRFLYLSLAMISSKGPNCEDRIILRKMRFDKGGVVDLAQEENKKKSKYTVKKIQRKLIAGKGKMNLNPKYRDKAARIVQGWWRDIKERYQRILKKIILIQSAWRGSWLRKYVHDIIYYSFMTQRFHDIIEKVVVKHVREDIWDDFFCFRKLVKEILGNLLIEKDYEFTLLRILPYFIHWKKFVGHRQKRELRSKNLIDKKELEEKNKKILKKYFDKWNMRKNLEKYISMSKDQERQRKKFYSAIDLLNGINKFANRCALDVTKDNIYEYLLNKMRNKIIAKMILNIPKYDTISKRKYFNKWNKQLAQYYLKDFKEKIFGKMIIRYDNKFNKGKLNQCFNFWRSKLPKDKFKKYKKGTEILSKFCFRTTYKDPLTALGNKIDDKNKRDGILRMLGVNSRYIKNHWRDYIFKWRSQSQKIKDKEIQNQLYKKLLLTMLNKRRYRILSNRFNQWKKQPKVDLNALFDRYKEMNEMIKLTWNYVIKPTKEKLLNELKRKVHPNTRKKYSKKLIEIYILKDRTLLRFYLYKWRDQCKNYEIYDLKLQFLKYLGGINNMKIKRRRLAKSIGKWKIIVNISKMNDQAEKIKKISDGLEKIKKIYTNRQIEFIIRLFRLMNKDYRPMYILGITKRLMKPRGTIRECFDKWRRLNYNSISDHKLKSLKGRFLKTNVKRYNERTDRDGILRAFFKWKAMTKNPEDYYPKITKGIISLNRGIINKICNVPFNNIKKSKNYAKRLIPLLKNHKNLMNKLEKEKIKDNFNKWKNNCLKKNISSLKTNIIFRTKNNVFFKSKIQILSKYFTKWKVYRPKKMDSNFYKAIMLVKNFCEKPYRKPIYNAFKLKLISIFKNRGVESLMRGTNIYSNRIIHNYIIKWYKQSAKIDPKRNDKIKTKLKRMMNSLQKSPLEKAFLRWIRILVKNPDYQNIKSACDKIKHVFIIHNSSFITKLQKNISKNYLSNRIITKVIPNSKIAMMRYMRNYFNKWKKIKNIMNIKSLKANLLSKVYFNTKGAIKERFLRKYFKRWSYKEPERKPLDLFLVLQAMDKIHKVLSLKYMVGFNKQMDDYGRKKFLRTVILGCFKYHLVSIKPYFIKWRYRAYKLTNKLIDQTVSSKIIAKSKQYRTTYKMISLMRSKWNKWKRVLRAIRALNEKNIPKGVEFLNKHSRVKTSPYVISILKRVQYISKKNQAYKSLPLQRKKFENKNAKKILSRWKSKVTKIILKEMSNRVKYNQLKHIIKISDKGLLKYFLQWKFKSGVIRKSSPIAVGIDKIRKVYIKDQFKKFVHRADMMNLKIPRGISPQGALIRNKINFAKSIALRNIAIRPYIEKWKKNSIAIKNKLERDKIFKTIISSSFKSFDKIKMRKVFELWRDKGKMIFNKEKLQTVHARMIYIIYSKEKNYENKKYFIKWMKNCDSLKKRTENIEKGLHKLKVRAGRNWTEQLKKILLRNTKFDRIKAFLKHIIKNNDKYNMRNAFSKWRLSTSEKNQRKIKGLLLKNLGNKADYKSNKHKMKRFKKVFLHWRILCAPQDYYERLKRIKQGGKFIRKGIKNPLYKLFMQGIKERARKRYTSHLLSNFVNDIQPKSNMLNLKRAMDIWRSKLEDTKRLKNKMSEMLNRYLMSDSIHNKLIKDKEKDIINAINAYDLFKKNKAIPISKFVRGIFNIKKNINRIKQTKFLHNTVKNLYNIYNNKKKVMLIKWYHTVKMSTANEYSNIIQSFLKVRLYNPRDKKKGVCRGGDILEKYIKRNVLSIIFLKGKQNSIEKIFLCHINKQDNTNRNNLKNKIIQWKNVLPLMRKHDAASKIQNNYLNFKSRKTLNNLQKRKETLSQLFSTKEEKENKYMIAIFMKYKKQIKHMSTNENTIIIQQFIKKRLIKLLKKKAQEKILELVRKIIIQQLCNAMKKSSRIIGDKGEVMHRTLEDIFIRRPYDKLIVIMKKISKEKVIKKLLPKIKVTLSHYWLPLYLHRWKRNTWDDKVNKVTKIQNWFKGKIALIKRKNDIKRSTILFKYFINKQKNNELLLGIPFKIWDRKTKYDKLNKASITIQKLWKGSMIKKKAKKIISIVKIKKMFERNYIQKVNDAIEEATNYALPLKRGINDLNSKIELHYSSNNFIDFSNDALRNLYLLKVTDNKSYTDALSAKRRYFDKWNQYNYHMQESAKKIQNAYRFKSANKKRKELETLKKKLINIHNKYRRDNLEKLGVFMRKWLSNALFIKCYDMSSIITKYLKPKLAKVLNKKFTSFFIKSAIALTKKRIYQTAKIKKLKNAITNIRYKHFCNCLRNKNKFNKLKIILVKNFTHLDNQIENMLKEKYFKQWKDKKIKLNNKRNDAATKIGKAFLNYKSYKKLTNLKNKKNKLGRLMLKLINDKSLQKELAYNIWLANVKNMQINDYSKIIHNFVIDIIKKKQKRNEFKRKRNFRKGIEKLMNIKFFLRVPIEKIKSEFNRKKFTKFIDLLSNKRKDHIKSVYKAIKDKEKEFLFNRILKIPTRLINKVYKKIIDKWRDNTNKKTKIISVHIIQKNFKLYTIRKNKNRIKELMIIKLRQLTIKNSDIMRYYFNKWKKNVKKDNILKSGRKINKFIEHHYKKSKVKRKWNKLTELLNIKNGKWQTMNLLGRMRKFLIITKIIKPIKHNIKSSILKDLNEIYRQKKIKKFLTIIFSNYEKKEDILNERKCLLKWKDKTIKLTTRERALNKMVDIIDLRRKKNAIDIVNSALIVKRLFKTITKIRASNFFSKLSQFSKLKLNLSSLSLLLSKSNTNIKQNKNLSFVQRIYKIYIYRKLKRMIETLTSFMLKKIKISNQKELLSSLYTNLKRNSYFNYDGKKSSSFNTPKTKFKFSKRVTNPKNYILNKDNSSRIEKLIPFFVNYLQEKINKSNKFVMDSLIYNDRYGKFCSLFKRFSIKTKLELKTELVNELIARKVYMETKGTYFIRLFNLLRKFYIRHIITSLSGGPNIIYKIIYLIRMTYMHKRLARERFLREMSRKWRFYAFRQRMKRKKLEQMYKSLYESYSQMANEVFGEEESVHPSVLQEFEKFSNNLGAFSVEKDRTEKDVAKKYVSKVEKKYIFKDNTVIQDEISSLRDSKVIREVEEENIDFYLERGSNTPGKFKGEKEDW